MSHIKVECGECQSQITIPGSDFEYESVNAEERQMGPEITYEGVVETECKNGHTVEVTHRFWEYPEGLENYKETEVSGCSVIDNQL